MNNNRNTPTFSDIALQVAISQIGESEQPRGSNSGPMVNEYLRAVGLNPGYAWCQAFMYWCYQQAATKLGIVNPAIKTAGVKDCWNHAPLHSKILTTHALATHELIKPGTQFVLLLGNGNGHTGMVERIEGTILYTIEGNSNTNGSREGYEVVRHQRNIQDKALAGFINYTNNSIPIP